MAGGVASLEHGDAIDTAITAFLKKEHGLAVGERTAEEVKITIGSAWPLEQEVYAEVRGRDLVSGLPQTIVTSTEEMREAIEEPVAAITDAVKTTLDRTPPELAAGIMLAGGGALLNGLDLRIATETGMPVLIAPDPLYCVVIGSGQSLEEFEALKGVLFTSSPSF